uniref:HlyR sequence enhancing hemolysin expression n=1 Tax=Escherichia coli TaxID=562 RepID=Q47264_ECOLX|nr:unnamed protein product [Escherichia coli]
MLPPFRKLPVNRDQNLEGVSLDMENYCTARLFFEHTYLQL